MSTEPIAIAQGPTGALPVGDGASFEVQLEVFSGPLGVLLHLIESRQLDILTVPLADLADGYVAHLASHPVDSRQLSEFVAVAAQLILLKSRSLLPGGAPPVAAEADEEPDEGELRRRLLEYRALRDVARALGALDLAAPMQRREPREADLPSAPVSPLPADLLAAALQGLAAIPEPEPPVPQLMAREITIGMQIGVLRAALSGQIHRAHHQVVQGSAARSTLTFASFTTSIRTCR